MPMFHCTFCAFKTKRSTALYKHVRGCHANDPNFMVYCHVCGASFTKWDTLRKHAQRVHRRDIQNIGSEFHNDCEDEAISNDELDDMESSDTAAATDVVPAIDMERESALFLLRASDELSLSHNGVNRLCSSTQWFIDTVSESISQKIKGYLSGIGVEYDGNDIDGLCHSENVFGELSSRYYRDNYYASAFSYVKPEPVVLGSEWEWSTVNGEKKLTEIVQYGYYVDIFATLKGLLSNPAMQDELTLTHMSTDNIKRDYCDGSFYKNHPLFSRDSTALQIIIYYDDIEVANPLGSRAGNHKLGCFYFTIANMRPKYRSSLKSIFLLAIAKSSLLKEFSADAILTKFTTQMNELYQGYNLRLSNGQVIKVTGAVLCSIGDIPASNFLGGFKEGVGFALRKCRMCLATKTDLSTKFHASFFMERTIKDHMEYLELIEMGGHSHSVTYGVNCRSPLLDLTSFDVTKCLPYDIMHTIFEGVATHHLQALLPYLIDEKKFITLHQLNSLLRTHNYNQSEEKPSPISHDSGTYHIKQSASQMMNLIRLLPFLIGNKVEDDDHWDCYRLLLGICDMVCSFEVHPEDPNKLAWMIQAYLECFSTLYCPEKSVTPKMHYLLHLPQQMQMFGPLRQQWCMRFESKNAQLKSFVTQCFKNVPLSVGIRHQQWLSYQLAVRPGQHTSHFLYSGDHHSGKLYDLSMVKNEIEPILGVPVTTYGLRCHTIAIHGIDYKVGTIIRIKSPTDFQYAMIKDIIVYKGDKLFYVESYAEATFNTMLCAFKLTTNNSILKWISFNSLHCHGTLQLKNKSGSFFVIEKDGCNRALWTLLF